MKILFLIPSLKIGGTEKQLICLSKELSKLGHKIVIGYFDSGPLILGNEKNIGFKKIDINSRKSIITFIKLTYFIYKEKPEIVQTFLSYMDIFGGLASFILRKKFFISERSNGLNICDNKFIIFLKYFVLRLSGNIICNSIGGKNFWLKKYNHKKIIYIPNMVEKKFNHAIKKNKNSYKILLISRFTECKNCLLSMKIFCKLQKIISNVEFTIIGEGSTKEECIDYVKRKSINFKSFKFKKFKKNLGSYFLDSDIFISLSEIEGMPNTVLECASYKCPLVLSNIYAHKKIFPKEAVFFVPINNQKKIVNIIVMALNSRILMQKKATLAYNTIIKNHNPINIAMEYEKNYQNLIL